MSTGAVLVCVSCSLLYPLHLALSADVIPFCCLEEERVDILSPGRQGFLLCSSFCLWLISPPKRGVGWGAAARLSRSPSKHLVWCLACSGSPRGLLNELTLHVLSSPPSCVASCSWRRAESDLQGGAAELPSRGKI